jgi:hypothetical protein
MKKTIVAFLAASAALMVLWEGMAIARSGQFTTDGSAYTWTTSHQGTELAVTAAVTSGGNNREMYWKPTFWPVETDSTVCVTFATGQGYDQQGIILRLTYSRNAYTALAVTRNVSYADLQAFNFEELSSATTPPYTLFGQKTINGLPYAPAVYPLNMCARTNSTTNTVDFVVWTSGMSQPTWGDPNWSGSATIPPAAASSGSPGLWAGHMTANTSMTYANMSIDTGTIG